MFNVAVQGHTRWAVYDSFSDVFFVNIAFPAQIAIIQTARPKRLIGKFNIPAAGPHGLDLDSERQRLFCACDGQTLVAVDSRSGQVLDTVDIGGASDVFFSTQRSNTCMSPSVILA